MLVFLTLEEGNGEDGIKVPSVTVSLGSINRAELRIASLLLLFAPCHKSLTYMGIPQMPRVKGIPSLVHKSNTHRLISGQHVGYEERV